LQNYKDLKVHYIELVNDLTRKFEVEFSKMQREKGELQAENEILRNGPAGDGIGKFF